MMAPQDDDSRKGKTKISVSIIGDAFVDLLCYLSDTLPHPGSDVRVSKPMKPVAGGSGINTATHLRALVNYFEETVDMDVTLQTVLNDNDEYGKILAKHAAKHKFQLINCYAHDHHDDSSVENEKQEENDINLVNIGPSTGHCIVLVHDNDRSFMTHLGVMRTFLATHTILHELVGCHTADPSYTNHHHHIHIAGYYNIPGFWKGRLKRRLKIVREKRRNRSHGANVYTTTTSLVPQYDATEEWDGQLLDLLPLIDFLILNVVEAGKITRMNVDEKEIGTALNRAVIFLQMAKFFHEHSKHTYVIVTLGKKGAVALYGGNILISADSPETFDNPVDPTGAGDAFAAGFINGIMKWRSERSHLETAEIGSQLEGLQNGKGSWTNAVLAGMSWACATGTSCVMQLGASTPAPKSVLMKYMKLDEAVKDDESNADDVEDDEKEETIDDAVSEAISNESSNENAEESLNFPRPVIFCGPSGVGKDTLINMIKEKFSNEHFGSVVSHTTRDPREGEVDGIDYNFTDADTMKERITNGDFIEFAEVHGNYYGTSFDALEKIQKEGKICLLDIDVQGVQSVKNSALNPFYVFISPPSLESLEFRLRMRGTDSEDTIKTRLANASKEMEYGRTTGNFDNIFVNDDLDTTFSNLSKQFLEWFPKLSDDK